MRVYAPRGSDYLVIGALIAAGATFLYSVLVWSSGVGPWCRELVINGTYSDRFSLAGIFALIILGYTGVCGIVVPLLISSAICSYGIKTRKWWQSALLFCVCLGISTFVMAGLAR